MKHQIHSWAVSWSHLARNKMGACKIQTSLQESSGMNAKSTLKTGFLL